MPRKRPKKPQWGYQMAGWLPPLELSESARAELRAYHDAPEFIRQLEHALAEYKLSHELLTTAPTPAEIKLVLETIASSALKLEQQLSRLDSESRSLLDDQIHRQRGDAELLKRLKTDLTSLYMVASVAERDLKTQGGRPKTNAAKTSLAEWVASILDQYGIEVTQYENGPWCEVLKTLLTEADGTAPADVRNILREAKWTKPG